MTNQFPSFQSLIEHIRSLESLPYERDVESIRAVAEMVGAITLPKVSVAEDDGRVSIEDGDLDEYALDCELTNCNESAYCTFGLASDGGIVVTVKIGDLEFEKDSVNSRWHCLGEGLKGLPLGYEDNELEEELHGDCYDEYDLLSEAIDKKLDSEHLFCVNYRLFRSVGDDIGEIAALLDDFGYDGFYYVYRSFYGWRKGMDEPWSNFNQIQLFSSNEVAIRYARKRGWLSEQ